MTRKRMFAEFEAHSVFNVLIMPPVAAGGGLTVIGANHVVHLERHWNPAKEVQAYRIGRPNRCSFTCLLSLIPV